MFTIFYKPGPTASRCELLICGPKQDYDSLVEAVNQVLVSGGNHTASISVESQGPIHIERLTVRLGIGPKRVSAENGDIVFEISPELRQQFISFIDFPTDAPVGYHHHYDNLGDDEGKYVARDSLPVVFGLSQD